MIVYEIIREIKPSFKKDSIDSNIDLIESGILDSFEILEFIQILEIKYSFNYDVYAAKHDGFKINNIEKFLKTIIN